MSSVLLLHGFGGSPAAWTRVQARLGPGLHVEAPALVGHAGGPSPDRIPDFEAEVERLRALAVLSPGPRHLVGYSLGARLALGLLARHQQVFAGATLIGVHPGLRSESERTERRRSDQQWCELLERGNLSEFVRRWQAQPLFATQRSLAPEIIEQQRRQRLQHRAPDLAGALRRLGLAAMPCYRDRLGDITVPVQLVFGDRDTKFRDLATEMARSLPRVELVALPGVGHNPVLECPDRIADLLKRGIDA